VVTEQDVSADPGSQKKAEEWSVAEVCEMVRRIGFADAAKILEENCIDGKTLCSADFDCFLTIDVGDGGLGLKPMQKARLKKEIDNALRAPAAAAVTNPLVKNTLPNEVPDMVPASAGASHALEVAGAALQQARPGPEGVSRAQHAERAEQQAKQQQEREFEDAQEIGEVDGAHQVWESMDAERVEECLQAAMRAGGKALNTSRLNIVGEGRAGKTAWLRAVSNQAWKEVHMMM
jgi:hypothetical protein